MTTTVPTTSPVDLVTPAGAVESVALTSPESAPAPATTPGPSATSVSRSRWLGLARLLGAVFGAFALFGVLMVFKGTNPFTAYADMFRSTFQDKNQIAGIIVRATPVMLAGLAVAIPARAGLINVGGEGQLLMGAVGAMGVSLLFHGKVSGPVSLVVMALAAAIAGGIWAAIAAFLRLAVGIAESVTTLLMNYIALDLMYFLIYDVWKDRGGSGQPATKPVANSERLPLLGGTRVHVGIFIAVAATLVVFVVFRTTSWGFRLRVVGGNTEAGRRAGLNVSRLILTAMLAGGFLAGLGGFCQLAGAEYKIRSGLLAGYGYVGFLASWLARHRPIGVMLACLLLSSIVIGGDSLQLDSKLPAASVNVLMALVLLGAFGFGRKRAPAS